jgi:2-hydroxychromene-2-carboxylate isomerase
MSGWDSAFYFDLASPLAYLACEQVLGLLPSPLKWVPVLACDLAGAESFEGFRCGREQEIFRDELERRTRELHLQPLRWPEPFPFDSALAMRAATYADSIGRVVAFAQAAFRQAFAGGRNLAEPDFVMIAAAACEMHPRAVRQGVESTRVQQALSAATARAASVGVSDVPTVRIGQRLFHGERALPEAAAYAQERVAG